MLNIGLALLIIGVIGGFFSFIIALLNMRNSENIQKGFNNHILCMIGMVCSGGVGTIGFILVVIHFSHKYLN